MSEFEEKSTPEESQNELLRFALIYAEFGWPVLPLYSIAPDGTCTCGTLNCEHGGKHPRTRSGVNDATVDESQIKKWWTKWPDANIGIATGEKSGILALDIDPRHGGDKELSLLISQNSPLPQTPEVSTGGGGSHYYFAVPDFQVKNMADKNALRPGVEIKNNRGYIVAPPSNHVSGGNYSWVMLPEPMHLAPLPQWLQDLLAKAMEKKMVPKKKNTKSSIIVEGERNNKLTQIAGSFRRDGYSEPEIRKFLLQANSEKCKPPLSNSEVARIAQSVAQYPSDRSVPQAISSQVTAALMHPLTDLGNAERLVENFGQIIRYCSSWKVWLVWDGKRWTKDTKLEIRRLAYQAVRNIYLEASNCTDEAQRHALAKHAISSEFERKIRSMISLAQALPGIAITPGELDTDNWILNVANGTLNLKTGNLTPHVQTDLLTKITDVPYDRTADCPIWDKFLDRIMAGNKKLIRFLQKAVGYALTGDVSEQAIFFLYGCTGKNGKSTFITAIKEVLGDYGMSIQPETIMVKHNKGINNDVARLAGARYVAAVEGDEGQRLSEALVKQMTGGDLITARFLYQEQFEFLPTHKIFFATNHRPLIKGTDDAIWRRIKLVPFEVTIPDSERDNRLAEKLRSELPGILRWAVEGCFLWQKEGLGTPPEVETAVKEYRTEMDVFAKFLSECCARHENAQVSSAALYDAYTHWCDENGERALSKRLFGIKLTERKFEPFRTSSERMWHGIGLLSSVTQMTHADTTINKKGNIVPFKGPLDKSASQSVIRSQPTPPPGSEEDWEEGIL